MKDAPLPAFELLDPGAYNRLTVQTSRGCPHRCEFCAASILITDKYKQKPVDKVLAEIDKIQSIWKRPFVEFADDNSLINREYWHTLLPELKKRRVRWFAETDLSVANDEVLLKAMRESGCAQVLIGLESPDMSSMNKLEMRANWKYKTWQHYKESIRKIQSHGIRVIGCFILGLDGHHLNVFDDVYLFANELELFDIQITIQTPFPGTPLYERLKSEQRLIEECNWNKCTLFDINFRPTDMSVDELKNGYMQLAEKLYSRESTNWRREKFKENVRSLRKAG